ncbi:3',5'-cyclic-AMP phosphodiesterase [Shewanella sedimentimangrovi]|uniref:3',5'-cyclic adenosine monophosphate phosphodiesterase CpdA n=1 Tax=Shewanella sedimentimangrovi TaxID=2814293 RepID=A0ABX7QYR2_9GAMM|nr:3',5'-cyclic-AMP phosphodiesterase [Shewanella sedimentimangrovi]QSX36661.1 3',5'-cyclic-AMP phosphodiesterase [Shewanella sedimentimangrovi]
MLKEAVSYQLPEGESLRLLQITDPHLFADHEGELLGVNTASSLQAVLDTYKTSDFHAQLMLATGDISQDFSADSYRNFVKAVAQLDMPCHYLPGNHDDPRIMHLHMQGYRVFGQQRILAAGWQILMLDSTVRGKPGGHMAEAQFAIIEAAIAAHPDLHTLLVMHHNPVLVGSAWLDQHCMDNGEEFLERVGRYANVRGVLWGHVHQQLDSSYQGRHGAIQLMATPSTCIQFEPKSSFFALDSRQPGFRLLELGADGSIHSHVQRVAGDSFAPDNSASGY